MMDLAVAYLELCEKLESAPLATLNGLAAAPAHKSRVEHLSGQIRSGGFDGRCITSTTEVLALATAIHDVLADVDPAVSVDAPTSLRLYRDRLVRYGNLLDEKKRKDALVTSRTSSARPRAAATMLTELLPRLRHIDADLRKRVTFSRVRRADDIERPDDLELRIAAVPMLAVRRDVKFSRPSTPTGRYYTTAPNRRSITGRLTAALAALDASGAHIGLIPEATCDDLLLSKWELLCQRTPPPSDSQLTFLLIGTGPLTATRAGRSRVATAAGVPPNRAVVLNRRTGEKLLLQDKQRGFSMDEGYLRRSGLHKSLKTETIDEMLPVAPAMNLLDSTIGRLAILICEDLGRVATVGADAVASAVSLALVPILATPILVDRWQERAGDDLVAEGTAVAVANSLALGREHQEWNGVELVTVSGQPAVTLLVMYPDDSVPQSKWSSRVQCRPRKGTVLPAESGIDAVSARWVTL